MQHGVIASHEGVDHAALLVEQLEGPLLGQHICRCDGVCFEQIDLCITDHPLLNVQYLLGRVRVLLVLRQQPQRLLLQQLRLNCGQIV